MSAWKLRAAVYGLLAAVAALVLWQRELTHHRTERISFAVVSLAGRTSQGEDVRVTMAGARVVAIDVSRLHGRCSNGRTWWLGWQPSTRQGNVSYRRSGTSFLVHEWPDPHYPHPPGTRAHVYMQGRVSEGGREVAGSMWFTAAGTHTSCTSPAVRFTARQP